MINITLPDGSVRQYEAGVTAYDVAISISPGLAKNVLSVEVNGEVWDLTRPIQSDAKVKLYLDHYTSPAYFTCLLIQDATNVQIYGLFLDYFTDPRSIEDLYGIRIKNSSNILFMGCAVSKLLTTKFLMPESISSTIPD